MSDTNENVLDLDAEREERVAAREGKKEDLPIRWHGEIITTLPVEFPLDVLAPLRKIDSDIALLLRTAIDAAKGTANDQWDATQLVIDLLASNPDLPVTMIEVVTEIAKSLLGEEGYERFLAGRPTGPDVAALAKAVFTFYGMSLGEASASQDSSETSGATSKPTSSTGTDSTPEESTPSQEAQAS